MVDKIKQSWWPIILAFVLPAVVVGAAMALIQQRDAMEGRNEPLITRYGQAYVAVTLQGPDGQPVVDREVVFNQRFEGSASDMQGEPKILRARTNDRGLAAVEIPKKGDVLITIGGTTRREGLLQLHTSQRDEFRLTLVLEEAELTGSN